MMELLDNPQGNYRFLTGISPYSAGVVAQTGYEIVRVSLHTPIPYEQGFQLIDHYLKALGRPQALSFPGFIDFNVGYRAQLAKRELLLGDYNPVARTNVAPAIQPPSAPALYAFCYTAPVSGKAPPTFVVAGAGDLRDQAELSPAAVVRPGESSTHALIDKAHAVMRVMQERLDGLTMTWGRVTRINLYTTHPIQPLLATVIHPQIGLAARHGVHWFYSHPPIADLAFEMDLRGVRQEMSI
jgi:hypothetical protein